jgi:hypothetical protein
MRGQICHHVSYIYRVEKMTCFALFRVTVAVMYGADVVASGAMQLFEDYTEPLVCHLAYCLPRARVDTMNCRFVVAEDVALRPWSFVQN